MDRSPSAASLLPRLSLVALLSCVLVGAARADEVLLKNGDRLTGTITGMTDGSLTIDTELTGTVTVPFSNIATFSSAEPLDLELVDGQLLKSAAVKSEEPAHIEIENATLLNQSLALEQIAAINPPPVKWEGSVVLGAQVDAGNTQEQKYSARVDGVRRSKYDRITFRGYYNGERTKSSGRWVTTKRELLSALDYDYFLNDDWFLWAGVSAKKDAIANLALRFVAGAGIGYQWVETDTLKFDTRAGVTWVSEDYTDTTPDDSYVGGYLGWNYEQKLWEKLKAFSWGEWVPNLTDSKDHYVKGIAGVRNDFTSSLFGEASVLVEWDSTPANSAKRTDVTYLFGLGWSF